MWGACFPLHHAFRCLLPNTAGQVENQYQKAIKQAIQGVFAANLHPRTAVQVVIQVVDVLVEKSLTSMRVSPAQAPCAQVVRNDGGLLPCALNATCAALVDAGILLRSMFGRLAPLQSNSTPGRHTYCSCCGCSCGKRFTDTFWQPHAGSNFI